MADENNNATGGDTAGNNASQASQGDQGTAGSGNEPQYMTTEQFNKAMSGWSKRVQESTAKTLQDSLAQFMENAQSQSNANQNTTTNKSDGSTSTASANEPSPEVLRLQKQMEALQKQLENETQEKAQAQVKARDEKIKADVLRTLSELGVQKGDQVYRLLKDDLIVQEDGSVKINVYDSAIQMNVEDNLKSGLTNWLNNEGAHYLPAKVQGGSGATGNRGGQGGQKVVNLDSLRTMKPSELAKVDLREVFGADTLNTFFGLNQS